MKTPLPVNEAYYPGASQRALIAGPPRRAKYTITLMIHCHCKLLVLLLQRVSGLRPRASTVRDARGGHQPVFPQYRFNQPPTDALPGRNIFRVSTPWTPPAFYLGGNLAGSESGHGPVGGSGSSLLQGQGGGPRLSLEI